MSKFYKIPELPADVVFEDGGYPGCTPVGMWYDAEKTSLVIQHRADCAPVYYLLGGQSDLNPVEPVSELEDLVWPGSREARGERPAPTPNPPSLAQQAHTNGFSLGDVLAIINAVKE